MSNFLLILTLLPLCISPPISIAQPLQFNFPDFPYASFSNLTLSGSSGLSSGALQVTFDSGRNDSRKYYNTGRILYNRPFRLWDNAYNFTASFNTSFAINMAPADLNSRDSENRSSGGGMAFIMISGPFATYCPGDCSEEGLGLFNSTQPMNGASMVAIEFDTFKDSFDPDDNHVGIDLKSIISFTTASVNRTLIDLQAGNTSVWVDYDGRAKSLHVYLASGEKGDIKPAQSALSVYDLDLKEHLEPYMLFGFSGSTGSYFETHCVLRWEFNTTEAMPVDDSKGSGLKIGLISTAAAVTALVLIATALVFTHKAGLKRVKKTWPDLTYGPRKFMYTELKAATNNFSSENTLGKGGFGTVYKGKLRPDNTLVAVKRVCPDSSQGEQEFIAEVTTIGRLRHKNLLPLLGWYHDQKGQKLLLVYEYMPNASLDKWLFTDDTDFCLPWRHRYKIVHGLARALLYLHEDWEQVVVHRDVKASNVMLDLDYNARLGDFGLARLINDPEDEMTAMIAGTVGYMAPECAQTGIVTPESDVYSFGAVALEVACGKRPYAKGTGILAHTVWQLHMEGRLLCAVDTRLEGAYDEDEMTRLLMVGLACSNPDPQNRPSIREVLQSLGKDGPLPQVPDSMSWPYSQKLPISAADFNTSSPFPWNSETKLLIASSPSADHSTLLTVTDRSTVGR